MTRNEFTNHKLVVLSEVKMLVDSLRRHNPPPYKTVVAELNQKEIKTAWGNEWTAPRLCMFLNRMGFVGLHGISYRKKYS